MISNISTAVYYLINRHLAF